LSSGLVLVIDRRSKGRMMILGAGRFALTARILKVFWSSYVKLTRSVAELSQFVHRWNI